MKADDNSTTQPRVPQSQEIPSHVRDFLKGLDKEETELLSRFLRVMVSFGTAGKIVLYLIAAPLGALILLSQSIEAIRNLLPPKWRFTIIIALSCTALGALPAIAQEKTHHSNPWLLEWIPATCCVTNDCCWEITEREVKALPDDEWQVVSTGQVRKRTDWSPDGKFYRCACDYDQASKHWIKHQGANTRCIFVPMRSAMSYRPPRSLLPAWR